MHAIELNWIHWIQSFRTPFFDYFFFLLNFVDSDYFILLFFPIIWLGRDWRSGARFFYLISLSGLLNYSLKILFHEPRPFILEPGINLVKMTSRYGFPSGAAQSAVIYAALLIGTFHRAWAWILAFFVVFFISLSRIYLGVHFPIDILGGWIVGGFLAWLYYNIFPKVEKVLEKMPLSKRFFLSQIFPFIILMMTWKYRMLVVISLTFISVGWGLILSAWQNCFLPPSTSFWQGFMRASIGIVGIFLIYLCPLSIYLKALLIGFCLSYVFSKLIRFVELIPFIKSNV